MVETGGPEPTWKDVESKAEEAFIPFLLSSRYAKGDLIFHPKFGKGLVLVVEGPRIEVLFTTAKEARAYGFVVSSSTSSAALRRARHRRARLTRMASWFPPSPTCLRAPASIGSSARLGPRCPRSHDRLRLRPPRTPCAGASGSGPRTGGKYLSRIDPGRGGRGFASRSSWPWWRSPAGSRSPSLPRSRCGRRRWPVGSPTRSADRKTR